MSTALDPTLRQGSGQALRNLDDCGCCEGLAAPTPVRIGNRPGLTAIAYRVGAHAQFKEALLAHLSATPALRELTTRDDDDFTIALLDGWATVADVLTFYQERIANESYLRTATERLSVLELARLIGYELRPGVAASTYLAFTLEDAPGAPGYTTVEAGTRVQSVPGPGEEPQTYETSEAIEVRAEWNTLRPKLTTRHPFYRAGTHSLLDTFYFEGLATRLKPGDGLLFFPEGENSEAQGPAFRLAGEVTQEPDQARTRVELQLPDLFISFLVQLSLDAWAPLAPSETTSSLLVLEQTTAAELCSTALIQGFLPATVFANLEATKPPPPEVKALRTRAAIFLHNAPQWYYAEKTTYDPESQVFVTTMEWQPTEVDSKTLAEFDDGEGHVYLDSVYPGIVKDSWVVLRDANSTRSYQVSAVTEISKSAYSLSAKVTRLTLKEPDGLQNFYVRTTTVFAQSEELPLARLPIEESVSGDEIELEGWIDGLFEGQSIIVCGELADDRGNHACEPATTAEVVHVFDHEGGTTIVLHNELSNAYVRDTVTINANVAPATHGETKEEVLGSGDASQPYQRFTLRHLPLTYVSASTPSGAESTLQVRVNDVLWHEVPTLYGRGPKERVYVTRRDDEGKTTIQFGDGRTGARLPTGQENVRATYRKGIGLEGLVKAGQLTLPMTPPLGVRGVTNPQPARGAADPEARDDARRNAPLTVLTLDRIVSVQDYEDFARAFAGIAKALATWTWDGERRGVFLTVAGPAGQTIEEGDATYENLLSAMKEAGDPRVPLRVQSYCRALFKLSARIKVHADHEPELVFAAVEEALRQRFSFEARQFGQPVTLGEVVAAIQGVPGVLAVDLDLLYRTGTNQSVVLNDRLLAAVPGLGSEGEIQAAELLTLDPGPLDLMIM